MFASFTPCKSKLLSDCGKYVLKNRLVTFTHLCYVTVFQILNFTMKESTCWFSYQNNLNLCKSECKDIKENKKK